MPEQREAHHVSPHNIMSGKTTVPQRQPLPKLTAKNVKDIKMSAAGFGTILFLLCHYAWIMRQWVLDPYLPSSTMYFRFGVFLVNLVVSIAVLMHLVYPTIYAEELEQEALEKKRLDKKSD